MPMVPAMQVLSLWGMIHSLGSPKGSLFMAIGKSKLLPLLQAVRLSLLAILIYPLSMRWGIVGTALAVTISSTIYQPLPEYLLIKTVKIRPWTLLKQIFLPIAGTIFMIVTVSLFKATVVSTNIFDFIISVCIGIAAYSGICSIFDRVFSYGSWQLIWGIFKTVKSGSGRHAS